MKRSQKIPICVVEDNPRDRALVLAALDQSARFCCVANFDSAEAALARLREMSFPIAIVDLELPGLDGVGLIRELSRRSPRVLILVLTRHDDDARLFGAMEAGALGYLMKPAEAGSLEAALDELQMGGSPMSAPIARRVLRSFRGGAAEKVQKLSSEQRQLLELIAKGLPIKAVAKECGRSERTVYSRLRAIYEILQVTTPMEAVVEYVRGVRPSVLRPPRA